MPAYTGTTGNDTLNGSTGADTLTGLAGNDVYVVNHLGDVIVEAGGAGTDSIRTSVLDTLATYSLERWVNVENLSYTGTLAAQLKGNALSNLISANSAATVNDTLYGGAGNDTLYGYGGNDMLIGGTGNDVIDGGLGTDTMIGGTGNDRYTINASTDRVFEYTDGGFDTIVSATAKDLRLGGLLWPEARHRIADSAAVTRESLGSGQVILFAGDPFFRAFLEGTGRMLQNAIVYGPGLGASAPVPWE